MFEAQCARRRSAHGGAMRTAAQCIAVPGTSKAGRGRAA